MSNKNEELSTAILRKYDKKVAKMLKAIVAEKDLSVMDILKNAILTERENGIILREVTRAYFRLSKKDANDCQPLFELWNIDVSIIQEALLEVLGYDKTIPTKEEQEKIIKRYFDFGKGMDRRYYSDPRYGLAAACAGWDAELVRPFLEHCLATGDAPVKYVTEKSLQGKYVKLR